MRWDGQQMLFYVYFIFFSTVLQMTINRSISHISNSLEQGLLSVFVRYWLKWHRDLKRPLALSISELDVTSYQSETWYTHSSKFNNMPFGFEMDTFNFNY